MFNISPEILKHLEDLAQLELPKTEEEKLMQDLNHILSTFEIISMVEQPPETSVDFSATLRSDEPNVFPDVSALLESSKLKDGLLRVKPVMEEEG